MQLYINCDTGLEKLSGSPSWAFQMKGLGAWWVGDG